MICYLDFEANCIPQAQEIISIGAVMETGETFYSLVRPHYRLDWRIEDLTGISQEEIENAPSLDEVMQDFFSWAVKQGNSEFPCFYVYGHCDKDFINSSISMVESNKTKVRLIAVRDHIKDISGEIAKKFNRKNITLQNAFSILFKDNRLSIHNSLVDAKKLQKVCEKLKL